MRIALTGSPRLAAAFVGAAAFCVMALASDVCRGQGQEQFDRGWEAESERAYDEAIDHYTQALAAGDLSDQLLSEVYARRAQAWAHLCENGRAIADFTDAIELNDENGVAFSLRGYLRALSGQYKLAEQDHRQALALAERQTWEDYRPWALQHLADFHRRQGDYDQALEVCDEALAAGDYATVYFRRAWIHLDQHELEAAAAEFAQFRRRADQEEGAYNQFWPDEEIAFKRLRRLANSQ